MEFHFETQGWWIETIQSWAEREPLVKVVWIFGSRATGRRTPKTRVGSIPDLDVAYRLQRTFDDHTFETLRAVMRRASEAVQALPVDVDWQIVGDHDTIVRPAVEQDGYVIFRRSENVGGPEILSLQSGELQLYTGSDGP
jgi:predicted nucleotidyltransferase